MANKKISELPAQSSPSASAKLVGVDQEETVQIPSSVFARKSELFSKNYNDLTNKPTIPSAYSHPSTHPASMITGLATVATSGSYNDLKDKPTIPSGGGGGASIIYATEKPSTPQQAIYVITEDEVVRAELVQSETILPLPNYIEIVDELPETGVPAVDTSSMSMYFYYLTTDGGVYGYVDAALSEMGLPEGWTDFAEMGMVSIIHTIEESADVDIGCLLTTQPKTRVYVPMQDGTFLELTSGIRTRFDEYSGNVSITEM